jgi:REP element-mobilizing transposase RayT
MPRLPRFHLPGYPLHVVQRGNNRQAIFFERFRLPGLSRIAEAGCARARGGGARLVLDDQPCASVGNPART